MELNCDAQKLYFEVLKTRKDGSVRCDKIIGKEKLECVNRYRIHRRKILDTLEFCHNANHNCDMEKIKKDIVDLL